MLVDTNSNWALFYPFTVSVNKCGGSCKTIDDPYGWVCVPHKVQKNECKSIWFNVGGKWHEIFSLTSIVWV